MFSLDGLAALYIANELSHGSRGALLGGGVGAQSRE